MAIELAKNASVGCPKPAMLPTSGRPVVLLVGDIGAGKTLLANREFQIAVNRAKEDEKAPLPVFLEARDAAGKLSEAVAFHAAKIGDFRECGAFVVVDAADEAGISAVEGVLGEARVLTGVPTPKSRVLITCRPLPTLREKAEHEFLEVPPLTMDEAFGLISLVRGERYDAGWASQWPASLREAIRRPLFAILLGAFLRSRGRLAGFSLGEVLSTLVEQATENTSLELKDAERLLLRLAALSNDRSGRAVPVREVATRLELRPLLESRLVVERAGSLQFPLALLREWFGAQGLITDATLLDGILADPVRLESWHYSFVIAVAAFDHDRVSGILTPLAKKYPGIASSIIEAALAYSGIAEDTVAPSTVDCGRRIRQAMQVWGEGIGKLATITAPLRADGKVASIGVRLDGPVLTTSWYEGEKSVDDVISLPAETSGQPKLEQEWPNYSCDRPGHLSAWAWRWSFEWLQFRLSSLVRHKELPLMQGPIIYERLWPQLVTLSRRGLGLREAMATPFKDFVALSEIKEALEDPRMTGMWHFRGGGGATWIS